MPASSSDPFSGLKLSEQTPLRTPEVGRDQRLFAPASATPAASPPPPAQDTTPPVAPPGDAVMSQPHGVTTPEPHHPSTSRRHDPRTSTRPGTPRLPSGPLPSGAAPFSPEPLDLAEIPYRDFTLRLTEAEYEALDDLERDLRRRFGLATSKNTLLRSGLHCLIADHGRSGERSQVLQKLRETASRS